MRACYNERERRAESVPAMDEEAPEEEASAWSAENQGLPVWYVFGQSLRLRTPWWWLSLSRHHGASIVAVTHGQVLHAKHVRHVVTATHRWLGEALH